MQNKFSIHTILFKFSMRKSAIASDEGKHNNYFNWKTHANKNCPLISTYAAVFDRKNKMLSSTSFFKVRRGLEHLEGKIIGNRSSRVAPFVIFSRFLWKIKYFSILSGENLKIVKFETFVDWFPVLHKSVIKFVVNST